MSKDKNILKKWLNPATHIIIWCLIFSSPVMFSISTGKEISMHDYMHIIAFPVSHLIIFYVNYFIFINKLLFKEKLNQFLLSNLLLIGLVSLGLHFWDASFEIGRPPRDFEAPLYFKIIRDTVFFSLTAALSVALKVTANWYKTEQEKKEMEKEKAASELKNLRSQLNPHFLFNTLNNIYSLTVTNQAQAQYAILSLSQLLRYVLYDNNQMTLPLSKEMAFIKSYIELMSLRLSDKVKLTVNLPSTDEVQGVMIAPLLFITLIENAFKHGVSPTEESIIDIEIIMEGSDTIRCRIENSNYPKNDDDRSGSGIGLENLRKRLSLIYPDRYILSKEIKGNKYISRLIINL